MLLGRFLLKKILKPYRYPATLTVTVKGIIPLETQFDFSKEKTQQINSDFDERQCESQKVFTGMDSTSIVQSNFLRRLPGQVILLFQCSVYFENALTRSISQ